MKVRLVYAGIGVAGFNPNRPMGDREGSWIGHGIASIGASTKKAGYDVELVDMRQLSGMEAFGEMIKGDPMIYGISVSPVDKYTAMMCAYLIKTADVRNKVIVGGICPTVFVDEFVNFPHIDTVVVGEGEVSFPKLVKMAAGGKDLPKVVTGEKPNLDDIPWVDRMLFNYEMEKRCNFTPDQKLPSITMLAGRGCPYHCTYCQPAENSVFGKPFRIRSPKNVVDEMIMLKQQHNFNSVTFWDDTFTFDKKWVVEFCRQYRESGIGADVVACSRADIICRNESMVEEMAKAGVTWLVIGFESGNQRILNLIKKGTTVEQNIKAAQICRKNGIKVFGTYMYGLPTETNKEATDTANMINVINPEHKSPFFFLPIEGTDIYDFCRDNGLLMDNLKERTIARTGMFVPAIKGVDYEFLSSLITGG